MVDAPGDGHGSRCATGGLGWRTALSSGLSLSDPTIAGAIRGESSGSDLPVTKTQLQQHQQRQNEKSAERC